jgi:triacylglycerol esterase/lipase EstA (alpha/beta hydrolase family)
MRLRGAEWSNRHRHRFSSNRLERNIGYVCRPTCADQGPLFCPPISVTIPVTRVVGPGMNDPTGQQPPVINPDGTLINPGAYVHNGIVSPKAYLSITASHPYDDESIIVTFNNQVVTGGQSGITGLVNGGNGNGGGCYEVDISLVRFATRNPGAAPTAGLNTIEISLTTNRPNLGNDTNSFIYGVGALSFQAMAPIVLVHGSGGEDGSWFNMTTPFQNYTNLPFEPFLQPFLDGKYPFDNSINLNPETTIQADGAKLIPLLSQIAATFGAKHVHLIAHSKGGLNSRYALSQLNQQAKSQPSSLGVYSLTTLSTPHHGSVLADYYDDSPQASSALLSSSPELVFAAKIQGNLQPSFQDVSVEKVEAFNLQDIETPLPSSFTVDGVQNHVSYYAVSANASNSSSHVLQLADIFAMPLVQSSPVLQDVINLQAYQASYNLLGEVQYTTVKTTTLPLHMGTITTVQDHNYCGVPSTCFQPNDLVVTRASSNYISASSPPVTFQEIDFLQGQNHFSEANPLNGMAQMVIQSIRAAQPIQ